MNTQSEKRKRYPRFRTHLFAVLAGFIAVALILLWIFQIGLLGPMYESIKMWELKKVSRILSENLGDADFRAMSDRLSQHTDICISVYKIVGQYAEGCAASHIRDSCFIHNVTSEVMLNRLYAGALESDFYTERMKDSFLFSGESEADVPENIVVSTLAQDSAGQNYLILLNAEIEPVGTTADTLRVQLGIITVLLLILAAAAAGFFSLRMSRSITQMSAEANKLALGNYDVHFDGGGTRETAELGEALNYAARELSALDSMQKDLLANISHDLRTPLTMISGYSEIMRDIPGEMTPENIQIIIDETHRLSALVNDILDLSKLQNGSQTLNCAVISMTATVRTTLERYSKLRTHDGYQIEFLCDREAFIYADTSKILQVVYNLVNNAINYTGEDKKVTIRQICRDGVCRIEVIDTGEGIPPEQLSLIWDRYYKIKNYYKRAVTGSGLGLSIVKNILLLHGAKFGVQSEVGRGSTFWFELPEVNPSADEKEIV
ncbi:MAG: HAMP domain-containing histidine kinase [Ruminococcaceae bacterium]|nr:HAMP domain-containing histidine kinase [Oscillospiraceae bacterium]